MNGCEKDSQRRVYANALLSNGELLFWYTGDECHSPEDFYKDFMYSGLNMSDYIDSHNVSLEKIGFYYEINENRSKYEDLVWHSFAKSFYRLFPISKDFKGKMPY